MRHQPKILKQKKLIIIVAFLILSIFYFLKLNKDFLLLWNVNEVNVITENTLTKEKVKIEFGISANTINRKNDLELFNNRSKYAVIYNGEEYNKIHNDYGENDFLITYNHKFYISFRHFKFNRRHQHNYHFKFYEKLNDIFIKVDIKGQDKMTFERKMLKIENAKDHIGNTHIDSIQCRYN